ncbi:MAG: tatA [Ilumatobacteraceae bacterium]|nr:tatA [Ilumatobacteraceae bacterium]
MFAFLEGPELAILIVAVLVLFGGSQLPKLAKNLGKAQSEFKKGLDQSKEGHEPSPETETIDQKLARLAELDKANQDKPADA